MKTTCFIAFTALATVSAFSADLPQAQKQVDPQSPSKIQIALLLDTSNSMDGLIDQARTQLWKVINGFNDAKRDGTAATLEVALYEYGNSGLHIGDHYIRQVQPLSRDLDELSKQLFALKTNGGEEYCGAVIQRSLSDLKWDADPKTYKAIFVAGNEPFTQGSVDSRKACLDAKNKGIIVNTIHCGSREEGIRGAWHDGAALAAGDFLIIDQDRVATHIPAPQDDKIVKLGLKLNETYLPYGEKSAEGISRQALADDAALRNAHKGTAVERAVSKANSNYHNVTWDLVDALREKKVDLSKLAPADLPAPLQGLKPEQLKIKIEEAAKNRAALQGEIAQLTAEREKFLLEERKKPTASTTLSLDEAMIESTQKQARNHGFQFKK